jgi:hypothetical protein
MKPLLDVLLLLAENPSGLVALLLLVVIWKGSGYLWRQQRLKKLKVKSELALLKNSPASIQARSDSRVALWESVQPFVVFFAFLAFVVFIVWTVLHFDAKENARKATT